MALSPSPPPFSIDLHIVDTDHARAVEGDNVSNLGLDLIIIIFAEIEELEGLDLVVGVGEGGETFLIEAVGRQVEI